ncbi:MAG: hypothetical protein WCC41_07130 [Rhodomicrobium sp.]
MLTAPGNRPGGNLQNETPHPGLLPVELALASSQSKAVGSGDAAATRTP